MQQSQRLFEQYRQNPTIETRNKIVLEHQNLVRNIASRFLSPLTCIDDLVQVGNIGLIKAIEIYDLSKGTKFVTYATPTISGHIKRHFRDNGWVVKVPRYMQELYLRIDGIVDFLAHKNNRMPANEEIALNLGVEKELVEEIEPIKSARSPQSIEQPVGDGFEGESGRIEDFIKDDTDYYMAVNTRLELEDISSELTELEKRVVYLTYYKNLPQNEISSLIGYRQMQVSRILHRALKKMRIALRKTDDPNINVACGTLPKVKPQEAEVLLVIAEDILEPEGGLIDYAKVTEVLNIDRRKLSRIIYSLTMGGIIQAMKQNKYSLIAEEFTVSLGGLTTSKITCFGIKLQRDHRYRLSELHGEYLSRHASN